VGICGKPLSNGLISGIGSGSSGSALVNTEDKAVVLGLGIATRT
jgi:hypothetical protein